MTNNLIYRNLVLNDNEEIIKTVRQSWLKLSSLLVLPIILIIASFLFIYPLFYWGSRGIILFSAMLSVGVLWLTRNYITWYLQTFIITNQRIIDIDQKGIFQKTVSDIPLAKTQDVFYKTKGIGQTLSRSGNVYIVLTDGKTQLEVRNVQRPRQIQQLIVQLKAEDSRKPIDSTRLSAAELGDLIKKIKAGIGEDKFNDILGYSKGDKIEKK